MMTYGEILRNSILQCIQEIILESKIEAVEVKMWWPQWAIRYKFLSRLEITFNSLRPSDAYTRQ